MPAANTSLPKERRGPWFVRTTVVPPADMESLCSSLSSLQWLAALRCDSGLNKGLLSPPRLSPPGSPAVQRSKRQQLDAIAEEEAAAAAAAEEEAVDWSTSACKPPYAYASLIYMALKNSTEDKLALSEIYDYVMTNFAYYRTADSGWKNSVRHNLSSSRCFEKVTRADTEKGKGGYWCLAANHEEIAHLVLRKKRRRSKKRLNAHGSGGSFKTKSMSPVLKRRTSPAAADTADENLNSTTVAESLDLFEGLDWHAALGESMNTRYLVPAMHSEPQPQVPSTPLAKSSPLADTAFVGSSSIVDGDGDGEGEAASPAISAAQGVNNEHPGDIQVDVTRWAAERAEASEVLTLVGRRCVMHQIPMDLSESLTGDLLLSGSSNDGVLSCSSRLILEEAAEHGPLCFLPSNGDSFNGAPPVPMEGLLRDTDMMSPSPQYEVDDELGGTMLSIPADWLA